MGVIDLPKSINREATLVAISRKLCEESLAEFIRRAWHVVEPSRPYSHNWHIDIVCAHLEAISRGEITPDGDYYNRLLVNIPPGTMKSLTIAVFWPAWEWGPFGRPDLRIVSTSYSEDRARSDNIRMRDLISSEWYQERWGHVFKIEKSGEEFFSNDKKGWRRARPFSKLTGDRGDRVIIDDPHSTEMAESEADRKRTTRIFKESVPTRLNDPERSAIVVVMQRLHEDDVSGVILDDEGFSGVYDHIMLPMRFDPARKCITKLGYEDPREKEGELLMPDRFPLDVVNRDEAALGPYATAGQMQQEPTPRGGGIIKDQWWQLWDSNQFPRFSYIIATLDTAYTKKQENDPSAMTLWGVFASNSEDAVTRVTDRYGRPMETEFTIADTLLTVPKVMMMYAWSERLELHDLVKKVIHDCKRFGVDTLVIEAKASGHSVAQEIRRLMKTEQFGLRMYDPAGTDKTARVYSIQHLFSEGIVYAPDKLWAEKVIRQVMSFPKGKHDDLVDTVSMALRYLREIGILIRSPEVEAEVEESLRLPSRNENRPLYPC